MEGPVIDTPCGKILMAADYGTVWQLFYKIDGDGLGLATFDHKPFAHFYEGVTGHSFYEDYNFGAGPEYVSQQLKGKRISVEGEQFNETVRLEDD